MTDERAKAALIGAIALLERAINYTLGSLHVVTPEALSRATPCKGWDLRALLAHVNDSLMVLHEATRGSVDLDASAEDGDPAVDPVTTLRNRACRLLGARTNARGQDVIAIEGCPLTTSIVTSVGAVEVAVHGWDIAQACGRHRPIPCALAEEMLQLTSGERPGYLTSRPDVGR